MPWSARSSASTSALRRGLGYLIAQAEGNFNAVGVFAGIIILAAFVLVIDALLDVVENKLITWRPNAQAQATS